MIWVARSWESAARAESCGVLCSLTSRDGRNYNDNLEVKKKHNFSTFSLRNMWEVVFLCKKHNFQEKVSLTCRHASTTSVAIDVNRDPLFGQSCMSFNVRDGICVDPPLCR